ncbi:ABC transporter ATP-binding protein [Acuticoccus sp. I52.16.1]|uniref:ABC transporter ATP-binding protein n=1 Tax=Acuticoccus sp. I52.16.1 TaxID=2928472 RepID=UPI001FD00557|nr:ABC transporter ATP-binding protein [Acuticoccus sp. I52.16.1]UOM37276.1 ABC transporter ATP-binding protein [Acuticoccus sp. I52.16.1]
MVTMPAPPPAASPPILAADRLAKRFAGLVAVDGMSLAVAPGEMVGLVGPNGAGKTTLFNLLAGSLRPDGGTVSIAGADVTREGPARRLSRGLGRTFQIPRPFPAMSVMDNMLVGAQGQAGERLGAGLFAPLATRRQERAARQKAAALLDFASLAHLAGEPARVLSGGQRKLLELARLMMADPALLLLDEPAAGVNPALMDLIAARIAQINAGGVSVLLIEHNIELVRAMCPRVVVMAAGRLLAAGPAEAVLTRPDVVAAYLGEAV